jgi:hypothetical protein
LDDILHREFSQLLETLQLKQALLPLFAAIAKQLWETRSKEAGRRVKAALSKIDELKLRRNALVDAFIDKMITSEVYSARLEGLENDLELANRAAQDAVIRDLEIDAVIAYGQRLLGNLTALWSRLSYRESVAFQKIIFPEGVTYSPETGFQTQANCSIFEPLALAAADDSSMASLITDGWKRDS